MAMHDNERKSQSGLRLWRRVLAIIGAAALVALIVLFWPVSSSLSHSNPLPVATYEEAQARIRDLWQREGEEIVPVCRTKAFLQGRKVARVIVFVHGYTSCPEQFAKLAELFVADGNNVLIAPMPLHGLPDRMTTRHSQLTARDLVHYADDVVDIARGLGDSISIVGLSTGGLVSGWVAQNRPDVDQAVLISPVFGYEVVPPALTLPAANLYLRLPDRFEWWDTALKEKTPPDYSYPRYSHHALAQLLHLATAVIKESRTSPPLARSIVVLTNANDRLVSNARTMSVVRNWRRNGEARVTTYEFPVILQLHHDLIDPNIPKQNTSVVYAKIHELMTAR